MEDPVPSRVREYADQVVAYVRRALGVTLEAEALMRGHIRVASVRGDLDVKVRRPMAVAMVVRGRGTKVDFGGTSTVGQLGNWQEARFGSGGEATLVELRASHGVVRFAVIQ